MIKFYGKENKELVDEKLLAIEDNIARVTSIMSTILELARLKQITSIENANYYNIKDLANYLLRFKGDHIRTSFLIFVMILMTQRYL